MQLSLTDQEIIIIGNALGQMPYAQVYQTINIINKQISDQQQIVQEGEE